MHCVPVQNNEASGGQTGGLPEPPGLIDGPCSEDELPFHTGGLQEVQEEHGVTDVASEMDSGGACELKSLMTSEVQLVMTFSQTLKYISQQQNILLWFQQHLQQHAGSHI